MRKSHWKYVFEHRGHKIIESGTDGENGKSNFSVQIDEALFDLRSDREESINLIRSRPNHAYILKAAGLEFASALKQQARPAGEDPP